MESNEEKLDAKTGTFIFFHQNHHLRMTSDEDMLIFPDGGFRIRRRWIHRGKSHHEEMFV